MQSVTFGRLAALAFLTLVVAALGPEPHASAQAADITLSDEIADGCRVSSRGAISPPEVTIHCAPESQPLHVEIIPLARLLENEPGSLVPGGNRARRPWRVAPDG
jgi:hypothetical protein